MSDQKFSSSFGDPPSATPFSLPLRPGNTNPPAQNRASKQAKKAVYKTIKQKKAEQKQAKQGGTFGEHTFFAESKASEPPTAFSQSNMSDHSNLFGHSQPVSGSKGGTSMKQIFEDEKQGYLRYYQSDGKNSNSSSGIVESIRTTPLFSFAVKSSIDRLSPQDATPDNSANSGASGSSRPTTSSGEHIASDEDSSRDSASSKSSFKLAPEQKCVNPVLPHYGLLGFDVQGRGKPEPIMINTNAPNSAFICGSQGSGKSYTLSAMLEDCLLPDRNTSTLKDPIAGVVFHYDTNAGGAVAEAASLASRGIKVRVLVSRSAYQDLNKAYSKLAGWHNIEVRPLLFEDEHLTVDRINKLMAFTNGESGVPLYMEVIHRLLRQTKIDGRAFKFDRFQQELKDQKFDRTQSSMLGMRMALLESFCSSVAKDNFAQDVKTMPKSKRVSEKHRHGLHFKGDPFSITPGTLTIIDLSDPFIEPSTACILFYICLGIINANKPKNGLVIALDEAHKYLDKVSDAANIFTDQLLITIREQRHNATRVVIATQEPTISERLLDLCSVSIVHRFTSPAWFDAIKNHLGGASKMIAGNDDQKEMFERIVELQVGESLVFSPSSFVCMDEEGEPKRLGSGVLKMKTRMRVGADAGRSVLVKR